jgi:hypothetical protein
MVTQLCRPTHQPNRVRRYEQVVAFCRSFFDQTGAMPSYTTIANALGIHDRATVRQYVVEAEGYGLLSRSGKCVGGAGRTHGQRIRFGRPEDAVGISQIIRHGSCIVE